ncbi:unnamed protein product [Strongylus vulgaris]|uniref:Uncharacterized protein n=1 Tax=Strongylus vulgaris TaxID=40348 RepID=A0A3P7LNU6_STRVU|nr:unnamed protein product [Strongylus vulgaris]
MCTIVVSVYNPAAAAMTYGVGVAQNNADLGGGGGMNDEEYDENSSARLFERSRIKALAGSLML